MIKGIIFDFDGVIADSIQVKSNAFADLYKPYGIDIVNKVIRHHEENGGMSRFDKFKYYHESFLNSSITQKEISVLATKFSDLVIDKVIAAPYISGVLDYIKKSYLRYKLFISTGTPTEEINKILKGKNIINYFTDVYGSPDKKHIHINSILIKHSLIPEELLFYGDSKSDIQAAENKQILFILIENEFNQALAASYNGKKITNFNKLI